MGFWESSWFGGESTKAVRSTSDGRKVSDTIANFLIPGSSALFNSGDSDMLKAQREANEANAKEAEKNRDYQTYMSNTSYQRAVNDLRAAGMNPILATGQGGASTPSGATSAKQEPVYSSSMDVAKTQKVLMLAQLATSAANVRNINADTDLLKAQTDNVKNQPVSTGKDKTIAEQDLKVANSWYGKYILPWVRNTAQSIGLGTSASVGLNKKAPVNVNKRVEVYN